MAKTANGVWVANTWEKEEHKCLSWELCAPGLRGSGKWSLRQRFIARARTLGEEQGKLTWCLSCLDQGFPRLNLAREQQGGSFLARANGERVSTVHELYAPHFSVYSLPAGAILMYPSHIERYLERNFDISSLYFCSWCWTDTRSGHGQGYRTESQGNSSDSTSMTLSLPHDAWSACAHTPNPSI